jgi:hypothetical protein
MTVGDFIRSIENGTADEGARLALWQLVKRMDGKAVIDYAPPKVGLDTQDQTTWPFEVCDPGCGGRTGEALRDWTSGQTLLLLWVFDLKIFDRDLDGSKAVRRTRIAPVDRMIMSLTRDRRHRWIFIRCRRLESSRAGLPPVMKRRIPSPEATGR